MAVLDTATGDDPLPPAPTEAARPHPASSRFLNRELSFLDYVSRVLAVAENPDLPVLERAKFLAIVSHHLDEFYEVRVSGLLEQLGAGLRTQSPDGLDLVGQLRAIR